MDFGPPGVASWALRWVLPYAVQGSGSGPGGLLAGVWWCLKLRIVASGWGVDTVSGSVSGVRLARWVVSVLGPGSAGRTVPGFGGPRGGGRGALYLVHIYPFGHFLFWEFGMRV